MKFRIDRDGKIRPFKYLVPGTVFELYDFAEGSTCQGKITYIPTPEQIQAVIELFEVNDQPCLKIEAAELLGQFEGNIAEIQETLSVLREKVRKGGSNYWIQNKSF